jgi:hypothetical protein
MPEFAPARDRQAEGQTRQHDVAETTATQKAARAVD